MEKKTYKETVVVTQADNGIIFDDTWEESWCENNRQVKLIIDDADKEKNVGKEILESINCVMNENCANRVKIEITYTPLED